MLLHWRVKKKPDESYATSTEELQTLCLAYFGIQTFQWYPEVLPKSVKIKKVAVKVGDEHCSGVVRMKSEPKVFNKKWMRSFGGKTRKMEAGHTLGDVPDDDGVGLRGRWVLPGKRNQT